MTLFDKYLLKVYIKYIIIVQALVAIITMFVSALSHMQGLQKHNVTLFQLAKLEFLTIPMGLVSALPITMVVASIVTVALLMRSKELMAYVSLGGRVQRVLLPFIAVGIATSLFIMFFNGNLFPTIRLNQQVYMAELKGGTFMKQRSMVDFWIMDEGQQLTNIGMLDPINRDVRDFTVYTVGDDFKVFNVFTATHITFEDKNWLFHNARSIYIDVTPPLVEDLGSVVMSSRLLDDLTSISGTRPRDLSLRELGQLIKVMRSRGLNTTQYEMILGSKYAEALSVVVLIILVVPAGIDFSRRYSPIKSASVSFAFGLTFWGVLAGMGSLGHSGVLPPVAANFAPHAFFTALGVTMLYLRGN